MCGLPHKVCALFRPLHHSNHKASLSYLMESLKWQLKQNASALVWKGQQPTGAPLSAPGWSRWRPVITRRSIRR
nr:MAG TPA_asm: hypothetical protein [Caudoviricetes sp.]